MFPDRPSVDELLEAVEEFLRDKVMPSVEGHLSFHARVAANVVGAVRREVSQFEKIEADQKGRLVALLGRDGSLADLNAELCRRIEKGSADLEEAALVEHLRRYAVERLGVDNPRYSAYRKAVDEGVAS